MLEKESVAYSFDKSKWHLGSPCKRGHFWPGTKSSLRSSYTTLNGRMHGGCAGCLCKKDGENQWLAPFIDQEAIDLPPKTFLGALCPKKHCWQGVFHSLRYIKSRTCVECEKLRGKGRIIDKVAASRRSKSHYERNKQYYKVKAEQWRKENPEKWYASRNASRKKARIKARIAVGDEKKLNAWLKRPKISPSPLSLVRKEERKGFAIFKNYWKEERKRCKKHRTKLKYLTDLDFRLYVRSKSKARKAAIKGNTFTKMTPRAVSRHFASFGLHCAYCGKSGIDLQVEHVKPIAKGGAHATWNVVPACKSCNFSKRDHDAFDWYSKQPFFFPQRWVAIVEFLESCRY